MAKLRMLAARIRGFLRPGGLENDFDQELESHLAMATEDKMRQGMTQEQARGSARMELGGLTQLRETSRAARGLPWLDASLLDLKLGLRMLRKSWGLTLIGGLAMTVAIAIGAVVFSWFDLIFAGALPLDEGDRVVAIETWDEKANRGHDTSLSDFERWREQLQSLTDIGAFQQVERNLVITNGLAESVSIAEMTASGFQLARVPPLLGRPLALEDEKGEADPVVVIGYDVWRSRFSADPEIVGQTLRLGDTIHTVVGVMPEGFAFPVNHRFWTPLRADRSDFLRQGTGFAFARLAPGVTLEGAQAELTTLGLLTVQEADQELQPRLMPYTFAFTGDGASGENRWMVRIILLLVILLLVPPCANIAILVYARTVTRQEEFAARYVLGASRGRIVGQIFCEVLVLAAGAAGLALVIARLALRQAEVLISQSLSDGPPFWLDFTLSFKTVLFVAVLAVFAALIAGIVPALKATGNQMQSGLRALGSRTGTQLGGTWTALVVVQVALSMAALPSAVEMGWGTIRTGVLGPGFAAEEFLTAQLVMERDKLASPATASDQRPFASRFGTLQTELVRQLKAEPGVSGVTVAAAVPGEEPWGKIEVEGNALPQDGILSSDHLIRFNQVDDVFFDVFDTPLLIGPGFPAGDVGTTRDTVIVNQTFAQRLLGDGNPLGRRVRLRHSPKEKTSATSESGTWYEVVGVVADLPAHASRGTMYSPIAPGQIHPASLILHVGSTAPSVANRLREITTALDPTLRVEEILGLDEIYHENAMGNNLGAFALAAATLSVLLLSAAGIYALTSFTVNQRRREIGIRSALGAQPNHLLAGIFKRALAQVAVGAGVGALVALVLDYYLPITLVGGWEVPGIVPTAAILMLGIALLAATGPARRGLRVDPIAELREG